MTTEALPVVVVVLAGGRATRMGGGDKALRDFGGSTLLDHVLARISRGSVRAIVLNANGDPARFARFGLPVVPDSVADQPGPLAGVLAGMEWAIAHAAGVADIVTVPTDSPFIPEDLIARLLAAREAAGADMACAASAGQAHPVAGLWPVRLAPQLRTALVDERLRRIDRWTARFRLVEVSFPTDPFDPFLNVNTPEDLRAAQALLPRGAGPATFHATGAV
jgi:molybdopterin-guanine dinucleotide biosynthesis protein A